MSIISIKRTEKCIVNKLRSVLVNSFVTTSTPAWRAVSTQGNSKFKAFNYYTFVPRCNSELEVLKRYWVKEKLVPIGIIPTKTVFLPLLQQFCHFVTFIQVKTVNVYKEANSKLKQVVYIL